MPDRPRPENPFSTRYTRPGALPYLTDRASSSAIAAEGTSAEEPAAGVPPLHADSDALAEALAGRALAHRRCAVVGPHGTGKSTLLVTLRAQLTRRLGQLPALATLRMGESARELWTVLATVPAGGMLIVDGYEQLSRLGRCKLILLTRVRGIRLIVTTHRAPWLFYRLAETGTSRELARQLTSRLLRDFPEQREPMLRAFDEQWPAAQGNIRQLWATLYEHFEHLLSSSPALSRRE